MSQKFQASVHHRDDVSYVKLTEHSRGVARIGHIVTIVTFTLGTHANARACEPNAGSG